MGTEVGGQARYNVAADARAAAAGLRCINASLRQEEKVATKEREQHRASWFNQRLKKKRDLLASEWPRSKILVRLAEEVGFDLVSDSHLKPSLRLPPLAGRTVEDALNLVGTAVAGRFSSPEGCILEGCHATQPSGCSGTRIDASRPNSAAYFQELLRTEPP